MADEIIRIGFVGAGANTRLRHIPGFQAIDGVELVSVCNRSRASSQRISDQYDVPKIYENWVDLIKAPDTDAICIGTWPYMHRTLVLEALENNKHVQTEARMAMNAADAHAMRNASLRKPNLVAQIVPSPHTLKIDSTVIGLINDGYLGEILLVDLMVHQGDFIDYDAPLSWRQDQDLSGLNIMQMGIWYEALMRWIGPANKVTSVNRVNVKTRQDSHGKRHAITVPDQVEVICEMASGPVAHMRFSAVTGLAPEDQVWLFGTEGTLHIDTATMRLSGGRRGDDRLSAIDIPPTSQGAWRVEEEFVNAIRGLESITHTNFEDGVRYMEFTEAVTKSAQTGHKVSLPL